MVFLQLPLQAVRNSYSCFVYEVIFCVLFVSPVCENMVLLQPHKRLEKGSEITYNRRKIVCG